MASYTARNALRATMTSIAGPSRLTPLRLPLQPVGRVTSLATPRLPISFLAKRCNSSQSASKNEEEPNEESIRIEAPAPGSKPQKIGQIEPRLQMTFTCTANDCNHRSTHQFSKRSYEKGIVIIQCPSCKERHLIADRLGWFKESMEDGKLKTVEDLLKAKGEKIRKGRVTMDGTIEYEED